MNNCPAFPDNYPKISPKMGKRSPVRARMGTVPLTPRERGLPTVKRGVVPEPCSGEKVDHPRRK